MIIKSLNQSKWQTKYSLTVFSPYAEQKFLTPLLVLRHSSGSYYLNYSKQFEADTSNS